MALLQFSALVSGMQGKLNGSVLSTGRSGNVIYNRPKQRKQPTSTQLNIRGSFASAGHAWKSLSVAQQAFWLIISAANPRPNRFGDLVVLSGYAYFKRMMALAFPYNATTPLVPVLANDAPIQFTPTSSVIELDLTDTGYQVVSVSAIGESLNNSPVPNQWNLYISLPVSDVTRPYFKTWYLIDSGTFLANIGIAAALDFNGALVTMPSGFRSFEGAKHLLKGVCFIPDQGGVGVEQVWGVVPAWPIPVVFPVFNFPTDGVNLYYAWQPSGLNIFRIRFICAEPFDISVLFSWEMQFAPSVVGEVPPLEGDYGVTIAVDFTLVSSPDYYQPTQPPVLEEWKPTYDSQFPASADSPNTYFIPIRGRLKRISDAEVGTWVYGFAPVYSL